MRQLSTLIFIPGLSALLKMFQVSGGSFSSPFYSITPTLDSFLKGDTYRFEAKAALSYHPFQIGNEYLTSLGAPFNCDGCNQPLVRLGDFFQFTVPNDTLVTKLTYYCTIRSHNMQKDVVIAPSSPPPPSTRPESPPPHSPLQPTSPQSPLRQAIQSCDTVVVGCGMAGTVAFFTRTLQLKHKSCLICPGLDESTSARSGAGWFLLPSTQNKSLLLLELSREALLRNVTFDIDRASYFIDKTDETKTFIHQVLGIRFDPVPSFEDATVTDCSEMPMCCINETRHVKNHGDFTCTESKQWYRHSRCCSSSNVLNGFQTWPAYLHLKNSLSDRVTWISSPNASNMNTKSLIEMMIMRATQENSIFIKDTVESVKQINGTWQVRLSSSEIVQSTNIIFGSGGFGKTATEEEYQTLGINSSNEVHALNSGILWNVTKENDWVKDDLNAWYVEFVDNEPKWFLWDSMATVLSLDGNLIYDESASYDERGRIAKKMGIKEAFYVTRDPTSMKTLQSEFGDRFLQNILNNNVTKSCDTRSKRLWRNYIPNVYGIGSKVNQSECSSRVGPRTPIVIRKIKQGIIDTISGPVVDKYQRILSTERAHACGNAASPGLFPSYLAPGSTLGNALVGGFIAGQNNKP